MAPRRPVNQPAPAAGQITGPTSAMTAFLREQGITAHRGRIPPRPATLPVAAVVEEEEEVDPTNQNATASGSGSATTAVAVVAATAAAKKRKGVNESVAAMKKQKLAEKEAFEAKSAMAVPAGGKPGRYDNRMPGAISKCGECGKKFTVTKYTPTNHLASGGLLCTPCSTELGGSAPGTVKPKPKPKPAAKKKAVKTVEKENRIVRSLQVFCLDVIAKHIADVEALGDIGAANLDKIAKIVAKHRALTGDNLSLFLDVAHRELTLYDCTNIPAKDLAAIPAFCPHLERITLKMCGRLDNDVIAAWSEGLPNLKYLSLYAPYLVTFQAWGAYLSTFGGAHQLEGFGLIQSPRFDDECITVLVERNPSLYNLQLSELGKLTDISLSLLHPLKCLTSLDISKAGVRQGYNLTDDAVVALLENCGETLIELVLDQNYLLTDRVLIEGVKIHCPRLRSLSLKSLVEMQSNGVQGLFTGWINSGLTHLNLHRCTKIENDALGAIINHSGHSLINLNLHSVDELEDTILKDLARSAPMMEILDISFVRMVDDFVVKEIMEGMMALKTLFVHGNNRVSQTCPGRAGVSIRGKENYLHVEL